MTTTTTTSLVERYQALEVEADLAEIPASEYRYEQCRIAHEATTGPGRLTQRDFAKQVGVSHQTVSVQTRIWSTFSILPRENRPTYWEAFSDIKATKAEKEPAEPKEITALAEIRALVKGYRGHLDTLVGFDTDSVLTKDAIQASDEFEALTGFLRRWAAGEEISGEVYDYLSVLATV